MSIQKVVAIDGPSGSGKSTITKLLAKKLGLLYIDTGAMYRAVALYFFENNIQLDNEEEVQKSLNKLSLQYLGKEDELIFINGKNCTKEIRQHFVSDLASRVSQHPMVREYLVDFQRSLTSDHVCIMEGRDIGTVVFPNAFLKIYLNADSKIRAQRRFQELLEKGETDMTIEQVHQDVISRDEQDMKRELSPLRKAKDAIEVDSTALSRDDVIKAVSKLIKEKSEQLGIKL